MRVHKIYHLKLKIIYQLINTIGDTNLALQLYNLENELIAIYSIVSTFGFFYYAIGILLLVVDTSLYKQLLKLLILK